jgi:intergrase/recombinase
MSTEAPEDTEMASLGVDSSYIDAFAGRVPESVLEKHYLDYSPKVEADLR